MERNTLDAVKRSLLRRSDWMGLNAARPLYMDFPSVEEMEKIGRRRKITAKEEKRLEGVRRRPSHPNTQERVFTHRRPLLGIDRIRDEVPSIRVGSNIHQSQTTPRPSRTHNPTLAVCQSESSESMLLDKEVPSYQQYVGVQKSPGYVMNASLDPTEEPVREGIGTPSVPLDQLRDSETFDEVKARSASLIELRSRKQQESLSKAIMRRAANRGLASEQASSSPIVTGRRLFQSTSSCSPGSDLQANKQSEGLPCFLRLKRPKQAPDSLSSDFLPSRRRPGHSREETTKISFEGIRELTSKSHDGADASLVNRSVPSRGQIQLEIRPKFTLEHQIEAEAEARGADGASNAQYCQTDDPPSQRRQDHSPEISDMHLAGNKIDLVSMRAPAPRRRGSRVTETSLAPTTLPGHTKLAESTGGGRYATHQPLHSSRRTTQSITDASSMSASLEVSQKPAIVREFGPQRQPSYEKPMRQRLGVSQQPGSPSDVKPDFIGSRRNENEAWMRFVRQDEPGVISTNFDLRYGGKPETHGMAHPWLQHHADDEETLPQDHELQSIQTQRENGFSPGQTIRTTANTTIHEAEADVGVSAPARSQQSETDFLSQLSPMEGRLDERLLNPSLYTNPARTERSYIPAPSRTRKRGPRSIESDIPTLGSPDLNDSSPVHSIHGYFHRQTSSIHSPPALHFHSRTSTARPLSHTMPGRGIPASFPGKRRSPLNILERASGAFNNLLQSHSMVTQASYQENFGGRWRSHSPAAVKTPSSARREVSVFPMNYTPMTHAVKKPRQDQSAGLRPSSSYSVISQANYGQNELTSHTTYPSLHGTTASRALSSLHSPARQPDTYHHAGAPAPFHSAPPTDHQSHQHHIFTTSLLSQSLPPAFSNPSALAAPSPYPIVFQKSSRLLHHRPSHRPPEVPFSARGPIQTPLNSVQVQAMPFSTPRPVRRTQPVSPRQAQVQPFSTPGPAKPGPGRFERPERRVGVAGWEWR